MMPSRRSAPASLRPVHNVESAYKATTTHLPPCPPPSRKPQGAPRHPYHILQAPSTTLMATAAGRFCTVCRR